jgi:hypothetical protein
MNNTRQWTVQITTTQADGESYAEARLAAADIRGTGRATLHEREPDVPAIGVEIAVARALSDLGHQLLLAAATDLQAVLDEPVRLSR